MATQLTKPIVRMVEHDGVTYKVVLSTDGIRLSRKGGRRAVVRSWDDFLSAEEESRMASAVMQDQSAPRLGMQDSVAADVLLLMRKANDTLTDATQLIDAASTLPSIIASHRQPPEAREAERSDWFIEPLLSIQQVSRLLGISTRRVRGLPIQQINIDGETRFHPSEIRRYLAIHAKPTKR